MEPRVKAEKILELRAEVAKGKKKGAAGAVNSGD